MRTCVRARVSVRVNACVRECVCMYVRVRACVRACVHRVHVHAVSVSVRMHACVDNTRRCVQLEGMLQKQLQVLDG